MGSLFFLIFFSEGDFGSLGFLGLRTLGVCELTAAFVFYDLGGLPLPLFTSYLGTTGVNIGSGLLI